MSIPRRFTWLQRLKLTLFLEMMWDKNLYNIPGKHLELYHTDPKTKKEYKISLKMLITEVDKNRKTSL